MYKNKYMIKYVIAILFMIYVELLNIHIVERTKGNNRKGICFFQIRITFKIKLKVNLEN